MPFHGSVTWAQMYSFIRDSEHLYTEVRGWVAGEGCDSSERVFFAHRHSANK